MTTTINTSILSKNNFKLLIDKVPTVEYYVQSVNIPGLSFTEVNMGAGVGVDAFFPGDKVEFENLEVSFIVDEDLQNFQEIYDWMNAIVPIKDSTDFKEYVATTTTQPFDKLANINNDLNQYSLITLVTNTNKNVPNKYFRFYDCFPTALSGMELVSGAENETVTCTVTFRFTYYDIESTS